MGSEDNFHSLLKESRDSGEIEIGTNIWRINGPRSPVYSSVENALPYLILTVVVVAAFFLFGWMIAVIVLLVALILSVFLIPRIVSRRVRQRALNFALRNVDHWMSLWDAGALSLRMTNNSGARCRSPDGDWKEFLRENFLRKSGD